MKQLSPEWFAARAGKVTASRIGDVMARTKSGFGAGRANYMAELIVERLTGEKAERFTNAAMQWGTDTEPQARAAYEFMSGRDVTEVGFVQHPQIKDAGASPDGLVGDKGLIEIKCPNTATHIDTLINGTVDAKYIRQMLWQMACTGREWCDFVSFDPRLPPEMQLFILRVEHDGDVIAEMEDAVVTFLAELDQKLASLRERYMPEAVE